MSTNLARPPALVRRAASVTAGVWLLLLAACTLPVQVQQVDPRTAQRAATSNVISTGDLSEATQIVLHQQDMTNYYRLYPEQAIAILHRLVAAGQTNPDLLFALAETSFAHAEATGEKPYYLAAAVYAFAFVFPDDPMQRPDAFDPRFRIACDIYNRGLTSALATPGRSSVELRSGKYALPFGTIEIAYDAGSVRWGDRSLVSFVPTDDVRIYGLENHYRRAGIGAPLAATTNAVAQQTGFQVAALVKAPVTALLRIDLSHNDFASGHLHGTLAVYPAFKPSEVELNGQTVPLEVDTTAALAYSLSDPRIWESEFAGFLQGDLFARLRRPQLVAIEPYQPGRFPVIFIHGTASSAGRWGDMINDLQAAPIIHDHFQFWAFSYSTGIPTPFSALQLRTAIEEGVAKADPQGKDQALHHMVLIGHSQGGLIAKYLVIDSGSRIWDAVSNKPIDQLRASEQTRDMLRAAAFVTPVPEVSSVIFIATPQHGSFIAGSVIGQLVGRLVSLPVTLMSGIAQAIQGNPDALRFQSVRLGSVWSMTPDNPALQVFANIPIAPTVDAHSIIPVLGEGPLDTLDDGVVTYKSAHIDGVESELVIRNASHSVQSDPRAIAEVRRILVEHLAKFCPSGCGPTEQVAMAPPQ